MFLICTHQRNDKTFRSRLVHSCVNMCKQVFNYFPTRLYSFCQKMWEKIATLKSSKKSYFFLLSPCFSSFLFPNLFAVFRLRGTRFSIRPESTEDPECRLVYVVLVRLNSSLGIGSPLPENFYGPRLILFHQSLTFSERYR